MLSLHPQYVIDENAKEKAVIIDFSEWQSILESLEELEDIKAYDEAKNINDEIISFEEAIKEIKSGEIS